MVNSALAALLLSAGLAGIEPVMIEVPSVPGSAKATAQKEVLRLSFDDIIRDQVRARVYHDVGRGRVGFIAAIGPDPDLLWVKVSQGRRTAAHPLSRLESGVVEHFPVESYKFLYQNGFVRAFPLYEPRSPQANVSAPGLIRGLFNTALRVLINPVEYAVILEEGPAPASVSLLREDYGGRLWVTHKSLDDLSAIHWFVAVNGVMYGMKRERRELVFFSKDTEKGFRTSARCRVRSTTAPGPLWKCVGAAAEIALP